VSIKFSIKIYSLLNHLIILIKTRLRSIYQSIYNVNKSFPQYNISPINPRKALYYSVFYSIYHLSKFNKDIKKISRTVLVIHLILLNF